MVVKSRANATSIMLFVVDSVIFDVVFMLAVSPGASVVELPGTSVSVAKSFVAFEARVSFPPGGDVRSSEGN